MAFNIIEKGANVRGRAKLENTVSVRVDKNGAASISFSGDVARRLGDPSRVRILLGSGEHSGFVALIPRAATDGSSYKVFSESSSRRSYTHRVTIYSTRLGLVREKLPTTALPFEFTDDGLIVDLRPLQKHRASRPSLALNSALVAAE